MRRFDSQACSRECMAALGSGTSVAVWVAKHRTSRLASATPPPRPHRRAKMPSDTPQVRRTMKKRIREAEEQAAIVAGGVAAITSSALGAELDYIISEFQHDMQFACLVASMLRSGTLKPLLTMGKPPEQTEGVTPTKNAKKDKLRQAMKRMKHMKASEADFVLYELAPHLFTDELTAEYEEASDLLDSLEVLCYALNLDLDSAWPWKKCPELKTWAEFVDLLQARYTLMGKRLDRLTTLRSASLYFQIQANAGIVVCTLRPDVSVKIPGDANKASLIDNFHHQARMAWRRHCSDQPLPLAD